MKKNIFTFLIVCFGLFMGYGAVMAQTTETASQKYGDLLPSSEQVFVSPDDGNSSRRGKLFERSDTQVDLFDYANSSNHKGSGAAQFRDVVEIMVKFVKKALIPIALILIVYAGIELVLSSGKEEDYKKKKTEIWEMGTGFIIIAFAIQIVDWVAFGKEGEIFRGGNEVDFAQRGLFEFAGIYNYFTTFVVVIAVVFLVISAFSMILAGGENEAEISNAKKKIVFTISGIALIISSQPIVEMFSTGGKISLPHAAHVIDFFARWANFILGLLGVGAIFALVWGGLRLIMHYGDDAATTEAKKIITAAVIGLVLAFSAWTLINFFATPGGEYLDMMPPLFNI